MQVRVWNAYASNNSGSYTIVGRLPSAEIAETVAVELRQMVEAHTTWRESWDGESTLEDSPLAAFCRKHGLTWKEGAGGWNDWPDYSDDNRPGIEVAGSRVILHHPYTVSIPPSIGELFYKQGGRVESEEEHAHHPLVVTAGFGWPWNDEGRARAAVELPRLSASLTSASSILARQNRLACPPVWRVSDDFGDAPLTVTAIFDDLLGGIAALRRTAEEHGAWFELRLAEAAPVDDPLRHLRPSSPLAPRFDVVLTEGDANSSELRTALVREIEREYYNVDEVLGAVRPTIVARGLVEAHARHVAEALEAAGARVELRRNEEA